MQRTVAGALLAFCLFPLLAAGAGAAGFEMFLKIDGIPGDSRDYKHQNEIDVISFLWGEPPAVFGDIDASARKEPSRESLRSLTIAKRVDSSSGPLFRSCAAGSKLKKAVLTLRKGVGKASLEFLKITLSDVLVTSYQVGTPTVGVLSPMETVTFGFDVVEMEYRQILPNGSVGEPKTSGWNFRTNREISP